MAKVHVVSLKSDNELFVSDSLTKNGTIGKNKHSTKRSYEVGGFESEPNVKYFVAESGGQRAEGRETKQINRQTDMNF